MVDTRQKKKKLAEEAIAAKKEAEAFERQLVLEEDWRDWCSPLIEDLLPSIVSFLVTLADFSSFCAVCRKWRSSSSGVSGRLTMSSQSPLLLLCRPSPRGNISKYFFDAIHHRIYKSPLHPLDICNCRISGYTHGHLVAKPLKPYMPILLVNIFTGSETKVPLTPNFMPGRLLLSSSPSSPGCIAILLASSKSFHYCRLGDPHWTRYKLPLPYSVEDVVFVGNRLYALTRDGRLIFFSFFTPTPYLPCWKQSLLMSGPTPDGVWPSRPGTCLPLDARRQHTTMTWMYMISGGGIWRREALMGL